MTPSPGAYTWWAGEPLKIWRAWPMMDNRQPDGQPGRVVNVPDGVAVLAAGVVCCWMRCNCPASEQWRPESSPARRDWIGSVLGKAD